MSPLPIISIVTPSYNQGRFLAETLQCLVDQNYPCLQVIIQDGGSTDDSIAIAKRYAERYPDIFDVYIENDSGQADALNRGFSRAKGDILGFLNSDDSLFPGTLHSVAREIDPERNRWVVFGRCLFTGEGSPYVGVEHPAEFASHFDQLAIWRRGYNTLPQPSVFWHRRVWKECGGFNTGDSHVLDYDLFCRFSRKFFFYKVDELWSKYRMHPASKSAQRSEAEILDMSIEVSKRYWGQWYSPLRWRCKISHWIHDRHLHEHARHFARQSEEAARHGKPILALTGFIRTAFYSPVMARDRLLRAWLLAAGLRMIERLFWSDEGFTGHYSDGWISPIYRTCLDIPINAHQLSVKLRHTPQGSYKKVTVTLTLERRIASKHTATDDEEFSLLADVRRHQGRRCTIEVRTDSFFVPRHIHNTPDDRRLSTQLIGIEII